MLGGTIDTMHFYCCSSMTVSKFVTKNAEKFKVNEHTKENET